MTQRAQMHPGDVPATNVTTTTREPAKTPTTIEIEAVYHRKAIECEYFHFVAKIGKMGYFNSI